MNMQSMAREKTDSAGSALTPRRGVLQRKCACGGSAGPSGECSECGRKRLSGGRLQTKLRIGAANDPLEREADRVADQVMGMPSSPSFRHAPLGIQRITSQPSGQTGIVPTIVNRVLSSPGKSLDTDIQGEMEYRFGHDFSRVRIHSDAVAERSAQEIGALAYTMDNHIVFGERQYSPRNRSGKKLLSHELTHIVQQERNKSGNKYVQRLMSGCTASQDAMVATDHSRARTMLSNAIAAVSSYNGTAPAKVHTALSRHFHGAVSNAFATWININLRYLWGTTWMAGYDCYSGGVVESIWACGPHDLATTFWCVPGVNIRLCSPYFHQSNKERSTTLIHEWVHKYGCNFDLGYEHDSGYSGNLTITQLLNADSFSSFIRDVS